MDSIIPEHALLHKTTRLEVQNTEPDGITGEEQSQSIISERKGSLKLLVALMVIFWPAAIYYAITRNFDENK